MSAPDFSTARRRILSAAATLPLWASGCGSEAPAPLRIGTNVWIGGEPLYLARELGRIPPDRIRLVEYPSASEVMRAFRNQALDGMVATLDELLLLAADGLDPRIVLVIDVSHGADVIVARPELDSVRALAGRRVAVESGALGAYVLSRALTLNGMGPQDVEIVHLESNEHQTAYSQGRVDAAVTFDPYRAKLLAAGARTLFDSKMIPGEIVDLLAVRGRVLERDPSAVATLVQGWFGAVDYLKREPRDASRRMGVRQQTTGEQFLDALKGLRFPSYGENVAMLSGSRPDLAATGARLQRLMLEGRLLPREVRVESLFAPGPLTRVAP